MIHKLVRFLPPLAMLLGLPVTGCGKFTYGVEMSNEGDQGVLVLQLGSESAELVHDGYSSKGVRFPILAALRPDLIGRNSVQMGLFNGDDEALPDEVEVAWQLAELVNCQELRWHDGSPLPGIVDWGSCTWLPDRNTTYRQTLDLTAIRQSLEYKRTGDRYPEVAGSRYTLRIALVFDGDQVRVQAQNATTNPAR